MNSLRKVTNNLIKIAFNLQIVTIKKHHISSSRRAGLVFYLFFHSIF
ncbi:hypothetical protein UPM260_1336 [Salmonella enterica subsp. enterica serovar Typhimurium]|nr:hypothetical protein SNSL317_A0565 [Salmonella enterica subsp. enterica serovar Newport str. SL317]EFX49263.1 hypothetical protein SEE_02654 [Salmonella enterica subsp. enterica serovar Typhimurium str. TN061786]CDF53799.1 hypothetical protein BN855_16220 [Salmonella enterica subsp. enterica serovar Bovismorbificans str. 3114]VUF99535.1 hypothetical protein UPM260_1336 [Salmonella enterica subsp. enterica serovar Typhimurium]